MFKNAMKYGVKYYLLKPIEEDKLTEIIKEIAENIACRKARKNHEMRIEQELQETRDKMKKRFLTSILSNEESREETVDQLLVNEEYNTTFKEGAFQAVFIKLDTDKEMEVSDNSVIAEMEKQTKIFEEVCEEYILTNMHSGIIVLLNYEIKKENLVCQKIEELYENLKKYVDQFKEFSLVIGVGEKSDNFFRAQHCLKTATDAIKYRVKIRDKKIIYFERYKFDTYNINEIITAAEKQLFISKLETDDVAGMEECVTDRAADSAFFPHGKGAEKQRRRHQHDHGAGGHSVVIGKQQTRQSGEKGENQRRQVVASHPPGHIAGGGGGQNQHGVDNQQSHPADGHHHHHRDHHHKEVVRPSRGDALAAGQRRAYADRVEAVEAEQPQQQHDYQRGRQHQQLIFGNAQDIPNKQALILGEAASSGEQHQPQRHPAGGKHPDDGVGRG